VTTKVFTLLCGLSFLLYLDRVNLSTAASFVQKELLLSNLELGIAFSAFAYSYLVTQVIGGVIADKFGPRWTLMGCVAIWVVTTIATGFVGSLASLFAVRMALGVGEGAALPASARAIINWIPVGQRGMVQGITHSFSRFGNAVAPPVVALLITLTDWRTSFVIVGILTAVWLVFWYAIFRDHPRDHPDATAAELDRLPPLAEIAPGTTKRDPIPWRRLLKRVAPSAAVYFCYGWTGWLYFTWLPSFFPARLQLQSQKLVDLRVRRLPGRRRRRRAGRHRRRPGVQAHRQPDPVALGADLLHLRRLGDLPHPGAGERQSDDHDPGAQRRLLLHRDVDRADLAGADGRGAGLCRHRQRHHQRRVGPGGDHLADSVRPDHRSDRQLDRPVRRIDRPVAGRRNIGAGNPARNKVGHEG
jgi:hypothetical protein